MSHISTLKQRITNIDLFCEIAKNRGYKVTTTADGEFLTSQQFGRNKVQAKAQIEIPGWKYPIAITENGEVKYDHWGSKPKTMELLGETIQQFNEEHILQNVPYDQLQNWTTRKVANGGVEIVLEY